MAAIRCRLLLPRGFCISKRVQEVQLGYGVNKLDYYLVEVIPTYVRCTGGYAKLFSREPKSHT